MSKDKALLDLADIATCVSNDFHLMHLNFHGVEFDMMHKKVLRKYYEQAAEDADSWYEAAAMCGAESPTLNEAATRLQWKSTVGMFDKSTAVTKTNELLEAYLSALDTMFNALTNGPLEVGIQNTVQTAIEYWSKEYAYFNKRRT